MIFVKQDHSSYYW